MITGQVAYKAIGTDAFQEADTVGITMPITKHNWLISDPNDIPRVIREAFHVATTGRPGPVLVDFPKDVANQTMEWYWPEKVDLPGYKPTVKGHPKQIKDAARLIQSATMPVILAGGGILKANATAELRELAELANVPVVTTLMARGVMPDAHPLCLGMPGMHGNYTAVTSMQKADLLINLGARFDDRVTGDPKLLRAEREGDPRRHRSGRARQGAPARGADRRRRQERDRRADQGREGRARQARRARHAEWLTQLNEWQDELPAASTSSSRAVR